MLRYGPRKHSVYRMYGESELLYIGCTDNVRARLRAHFNDARNLKRGKGWVPRTVRILVEDYPDYYSARYRERELIAEHPETYNIADRGGLTPSITWRGDPEPRLGDPYEVEPGGAFRIKKHAPRPPKPLRLEGFQPITNPFGGPPMFPDTRPGELAEQYIN